MDMLDDLLSSIRYMSGEEYRQRAICYASMFIPCGKIDAAAMDNLLLSYTGRVEFSTRRNDYESREDDKGDHKET